MPVAGQRESQFTSSVIEWGGCYWFDLTAWRLPGTVTAKLSIKTLAAIL